MIYVFIIHNLADFPIWLWIVLVVEWNWEMAEEGRTKKEWDGEKNANAMQTQKVDGKKRKETNGIILSRVCNVRRKQRKGMDLQLQLFYIQYSRLKWWMLPSLPKVELDTLSNQISCLSFSVFFFLFSYFICILNLSYFFCSSSRYCNLSTDFLCCYCIFILFLSLLQ